MFENCVEFAVIEGKRLKLSTKHISDGGAQFKLEKGGCLKSHSGDASLLGRGLGVSSPGIP